MVFMRRRTDSGDKYGLSMKRNLESFKKAGFFLRWLPMIGSVTFMVLVSIVSAFSFSQFETANSCREHTYVVLASAQPFLNYLFRIQQYSPNYVFTAQSTVLKT